MKAGTLSAKEKPNDLKADLGTDLKIRFALQRRALAFDQAALITWALHDSWIAVLFHRMAESPPSGHGAVSMEQCLRADRKLFLKMSEQCRANINALPGQPRPLDVAMQRFMDHSDVLYLIMPLPLSSSYSHAKDHTATRSDPGPYTAAAPQAKGNKSKGRGKGSVKGKGKPKGKGKGKSSAPPGCLSRTEDGRNICYGFNRPGGCDQTSTAVGSACSRGFHICGRAGCHGNHASYDCPSQVH